MIFQDLGFLPLHLHWLTRVAKFWYSLQSLPGGQPLGRRRQLFSAVFHGLWAISSRRGCLWVGSFRAALLRVEYHLSFEGPILPSINLQALAVLLRAQARVPRAHFPLSRISMRH